MKEIAREIALVNSFGKEAYTYMTQFLLCTQFLYKKYIDGLQFDFFSMFKLCKAEMFLDVS